MNMAVSTAYQLEREFRGFESEAKMFLPMSFCGPVRTTFELRSDEQGLSSDEIFRKRLGEHLHTINSPQAPHVQIVQGEPVIVTHRNDRPWLDRPSEEQILADCTIMTPVPQTYDTYKCNDCGVILSGYKVGDVDVEAHIWKGSARCRYIKAKFRGRENLLLALHGRVRFNKGCVALPQYLLCANEGYVTVAGRKLCVICCATKGNPHDYMCDAVTQRMIRQCKTLGLYAPRTDGPVFRDTQLGEFKPTRDSAVWIHSEFKADPANMHYIPGTTDSHHCPACGITIKDFVENDTLLGEHIYHVYNKGEVCPYIEERFQGKRDNLQLILGYERYRRGMFAFPDAVANNRYGFVEINGRHRCVVCAASGEYGAYYTANQHHRIMCNDIKECILMKLRFLR